MREILDSEVNDGPALAAQGWHYVEVRECVEKQSAKGEDYYKLDLVEARTKAFVASDVCMLEGKGNGIGVKKLRALGALARNDAGSGWELQLPRDVVGMRAYVHVYHERYEWGGEERTRCSVSLKQGECGYRPMGSPPDEALVGPPVPDDEPMF